MKYLADSIVEYILEECSKVKVSRFVLPSYPAGLLRTIGVEMEEHFSRTDGKVRFLYGIAYKLGLEWLADDAGNADFEVIKSREWYNEDNNLVSIRNKTKEDEDRLVIVIAGYDHIDDAASLKDFFRLDQQSIWRICLRKSFVPWIYECFRHAVDPDDAAEDFKKVSDLLESLYDNGLTDLLGISTYLEDLDLAPVTNSSDAYKLIVSNLKRFSLPAMPGLAKGRTSKSISKYVTAAQSFFNYGMFLDDFTRCRTLNKITAFKTVHGEDQLDNETLGDFTSMPVLLSSLEAYVTDRSEPSREILKTADFVYIIDSILGYRIGPGEKPPPPPKTRKLRGMPPEVFLRAMWMTLADYKRDARFRSLLALEELHRITIRSTAFKHDFDAGETTDRIADAEVAGRFLCQVLGGVDEFLGACLDNEDSAIDIDSSVCPRCDEDSIVYTKSSISEPHLRFTVEVYSRDGESIRREFEWCLPQNHQCRLLVDLYQWALDEYGNATNALPVFAVPYLPELFMSRDEEDVNRLMGTVLQSTASMMVDLLAAQGMDDADPVMPLLADLSIKYQLFLKKFESSGFFSALDSHYAQLKSAYCKTYEAFLANCRTSLLGPILLKAFMVVGEDAKIRQDWAWSKCLEACVVTPLHPALLEMIQSQQAFLREGFGVYARRALAESGDKFFAEKHWNRMVDLAKMQWPVFGTLRDLNGVLNTSVRSYGYVHLVGECLDSHSVVESRLLLDYDESEDEDVADTDLFQETRSSQLIAGIILDYHKLHSHAHDGISVGAYCGYEIQPIIAGIDAYLASILDLRGDRTYALQLTIFSDSGDDSAIMRWVNAWTDRWQESDLSTSKQHYSNCSISIAYRVVQRDRNKEQIAALLRTTDLDISIFAEFIESGASSFEQIAQDSYSSEVYYRKFPVLEKACCRVIGGGRDKQRERVLSNQRFTLGPLHAEVLACVKNGPSDSVKRHLVVGYSDFRPWERVIDAAHSSSAWVVCIDPSVDEQLLAKEGAHGTVGREIIGFGSGVGPHGENNYTVSTEQFSIKDIQKRIGIHIFDKLGFEDRGLCNRLAESLVKEASRMAGLSVVKATGPSDYVRDYIAYAVVRKLLPDRQGAFCDELVSLDAFRHWFDDAPDGTRPDLLRLSASIVDGYFQINAQIIECKLAMESDGYLEKARQQVESGLRRLIPCFRPREKRQDVDDRPDERYWWMQLHRLLASKGTTTKPHYEKTLLALERLSEGYFSINWRAAAVAIWTDLADGELRCDPRWQFSFDGQETAISVVTSGRNCIQGICLGNVEADIFGTGKHIAYVHVDQVGEKDSARNDEGRTDVGIPNANDTPELDTHYEPAIEDTPGETVIVVERRVPDRILLGRGPSGGRDVYWEFGHPDLANRHILVFGTSGTGKTYTIQALISELGRSGQNTLIVDYTSGFTTSQLEGVVVQNLNPQQHVVRREPLAVNPFRQQCDYIDDLTLDEDPANTGQRVSGVFSEVYNLGDQQKSALYCSIRDGIIRDGNRFDLRGLMAGLEDLRDLGGTVGSSAGSVLSKIQPFVDMNPFGAEGALGWEKVFSDDDSRCHVIQLAGFAKDTCRLITEFALIDLYWYYRGRGNKDKPKVIVLDEIQNLDHRLESPLGQFLTEGRKFGISLILATQTLSNLDRDERDRLFQASHKLFFKPADTEVKSFAQILENATGTRSEDWVERLSSLKRGECYSLGSAVNQSNGMLESNKCFKLTIASLEARFAGGI